MPISYLPRVSEFVCGRCEEGGCGGEFVEGTECRQGVYSVLEDNGRGGYAHWGVYRPYDCVVGAGGGY